MARRMFNSQIINSDPFLDMPSSSQALYFHLGMHADDEGFVYPKQVMRLVSASDDDLKILLSKKFLLPFESGVVVVKHWNVNNTIRYDRKLRTTHEAEKAQLSLDDGGVYRLIDNQHVASTPHEGRISKEVSNKVSKTELSTKAEQLRKDIALVAKGKRVT